MFVQKNGENDKKKYSIAQKTPCYLCENEACTYYVCGECYKRYLVSSASSGVLSRRSNHNKLPFLEINQNSHTCNVENTQIHQLEAVK